MRNPDWRNASGALIERWRERVAVLRQCGAPGQADAVALCAAELEEFEREREIEGLTLREAVAESGLSYSALEKMVRRGELQNVGEKGRPRVRRGDLPRKVRRQTTAPALAEAVLTGRGRLRLDRGH